MALGVEKGSWGVDNNINMTYVILLYSLLLLQDGGFQKMLVFDRTSFSPSYSGILQLVHIYYPFH